MSNPFDLGSEFVPLDDTARAPLSQVERPALSVGAGLEEEASRLRKKFRGSLPSEVLGLINDDTRPGREQILRKRLHNLLTTAPASLRVDFTTFFREEAAAVARLVAYDAASQKSFSQDLLWDFVTEFSAHTPHLAAVAYVCCEGVRTLAAAVFESWRARFSIALASGAGVAARLLLRFLGECVGVKLVPAEVFVSQCLALLPPADSTPSPFPAPVQEYLVSLVLSALCWAGGYLSAVELGVLCVPLNAFFAARGTVLLSGTAPAGASAAAAAGSDGDVATAPAASLPDITSRTPFRGASAPAPSMADSLTQLWSCVSNCMDKNDWLVAAISRPSPRALPSEKHASASKVAFEPAAMDAALVQVGCVRPPIMLVGPGSLTTPKFAALVELDRASAVDLLCMRDMVDDALSSFHPFHADAAAYIMQSTSAYFPAAGIIVERCLAQILDPTPYHPAAYYSSLLVNCVIKDRMGNSMSTAVAHMMRALFKNVGLLCEGSTDALAKWLGFHCSNFGYKWIWNEWLPALSYDPEHPQRRFLLSCVYYTFKLIGPLDRASTISSVLPAELVAKVPEPQWPNSRYFSAKQPPALPSADASGGAGTGPAGDGGADGAATEQAEDPDRDPRLDQLMSCFKEKLDDASMGEKLEDLWEDEVDRISMFTHAMLVYSHANYKNVAAMYTRYELVLKSAARVPMLLTAVLDAVLGVWQRSPDVITVCFNLLLNAGIGTSAVFVSWLLGAGMSERVVVPDLLERWRWDTLFSIMDAAQARVFAAESALAQVTEFDPTSPDLDSLSFQSNAAKDAAVAAIRAFCEGCVRAWGMDGEEQEVSLLREVLWSRIRTLVFKYNTLLAKCPASALDDLYESGEGGSFLHSAVRVRLSLPDPPCPLLRDRVYTGAY